MENYQWFVRDMSSQSAEDVLLERYDRGIYRGQYTQKDGAFLVRSSPNMSDALVLSVKYEGAVQHISVSRDSMGKYSLSTWVNAFDSMHDLVTYHRTASVNRSQNVVLKDFLWLKVIADYDFKADEDDELPLTKGDIVLVINSQADPNWWTGAIKRNNKICRGQFPSNYVSAYFK